MTVFISIAVAVLAADRAAKLLAQNLMTLGEHIRVIGGLLELRLTHNAGMALGFLSGYTIAGIVLPLLAITAGVFILRRYRLSRFMMVAVGLIFGGFLANFIDRVLFGYVVDMVYFPWLPFFICNIADIAITFGAVLTGVSLIFRPKDWLAKKPEGAAHE